MWEKRFIKNSHDSHKKEQRRGDLFLRLLELVQRDWEKKNDIGIAMEWLYSMEQVTEYRNRF